MVVMTDKTKITWEAQSALENAMVAGGYDNPHEYVMPPKTTQTNVPCPICNESLPFFRGGNSYRIKCSTKGCIDVGVRGL